MVDLPAVVRGGQIQQRRILSQENQRDRAEKHLDRVAVKEAEILAANASRKISVKISLWKSKVSSPLYLLGRCLR